jgi:hypothetical protein
MLAALGLLALVMSGDDARAGGNYADVAIGSATVAPGGTATVDLTVTPSASVGATESGANCGDTTDNDADTVVDDGCPLGALDVTVGYAAGDLSVTGCTANFGGACNALLNPVTWSTANLSGISGVAGTLTIQAGPSPVASTLTLTVTTCADLSGGTQTCSTTNGTITILPATPSPTPTASPIPSASPSPTPSPTPSTDFDNDQVLNTNDNCPLVQNGPGQSQVPGVGNQTDSDGDGVPGTHPPSGAAFGGDACDSDDDNDEFLDWQESAGCRARAEDYDDYEDTNGCPDSDNDSDGLCDPGLFSISCTGIDRGRTAFFPAGHSHENTEVDCRNVAEDFDGFKDTDGCPEPDNDNDGFSDADDQCDGNDNHAGPDGVLGSGEDQDHDGILDPGEDTYVSEGILTSDDSVRTYEDFDAIFNTDGCHDSPDDDSDADGYTDEAEILSIGTNASKPCGLSGWPSNLYDLGTSVNRLDIQDLLSFVAPIRRLNTTPGDDGFSPRWDLRPGAEGGLSNYITIQDLLALLGGTTGSPPMFNGDRAFNRTCPFQP